MYCQFGNKWANLHLGPMWFSTIATELSEQAVFRSTDPLNVNLFNLIYSKFNAMFQAKANIPGISSHSIRKCFATSEVTTNAQI